MPTGVVGSASVAASTSWAPPRFDGRVLRTREGGSGSMSSCLEHPNIQAALKRAALYPPAPEVAELVTSACDHPEIEPDGILEITRGGWGNEEQSADDVL